MRRDYSLTLGIACILVLGQWTAYGAETKSAAFGSSAELKGWTVKGDVTIDASKDRSGNDGGALKIGPKASASWKLRDGDAGGTVEFWVYESAKAPSNPKQRGTGPYYGALQSDGRVLAPGSLYAPYLSGDKTYAMTGFNPAQKEQHYFGVQHLGLKRTPGWHKWIFVFDPEQGVSILHNGTNVNSKRRRFEWHKTKVNGFSGVVFVGDATDAGQTIWVDDVKVTLAGAMKVKPADSAPPPPPPAWPAKDPPLEGEAPAFAPALLGKHPRLLFSREDLGELKGFAKTPVGRLLWKRVVEYLPSCKAPGEAKFLTDATDGQRHGLWRMPTVALHYVITGDRQSFDRTVDYMKFLLSLENWETGEIDNGMSAANIMIGAALAYDWLYHDLEPEFRETFRKKLWEHARRMYHAGHLLGDKKGAHYWEGDPQNNHRWHRDAGFALCALAAYEGQTEQQWLLAKLRDELNYVGDWLPSDGTSHESPTYMIFGAAHLTLAMQAADRCLDGNHLQRPFFKRISDYMIQTVCPGLEGRFVYGDQGGAGVGELNYDVFELKAAGAHGRGDILALLNQRLERKGVGAHIAWLGFVWHPQTLKPRPGATPTTSFFPDLGLMFVRDKWESGGRAAMFKCGPFGGYLLNQFSHRNKMKYINVAHDDPDANSFLLFTDGELVAETDRYSKAKKSANLNTILVNGIGQTVRGRKENTVWWQPGGDMSRIAVVTALARKGGNLALEGEAAGSYPANPKDGKRPALTRYRRSLLWIEGQYVLILDDIRAEKPADISWLIQSGAMQIADPAKHRYVLKKGQASCPFQVASTQALSAKMVDSPADHRGKPLGWKQLRLEANTATIRMASVFDLWGKDDLTVNLKADGANHATVTVTGGGASDKWDWVAGEGRFGPSKIAGTSSGGAEIITLNQPEPETRALIEDIHGR